MTCHRIKGALLALMLLPSIALGKLTPEELAQLETTLTPMGAIRAGNADGSIPAWTGSMYGLPAGLQWGGPGTPYPDPYADEKPLFTVTAANMEQHRERLAPGLIAMLETYPETFRIPVYPSHRDGRFDDRYHAKIRYNAEHVELYNNDEGIKGFTGGIAFPLPKTGAEVVWMTRTAGPHYTMYGLYSDIAVFSNGSRSVRKSDQRQESPYANLDLKLGVEYPALGGFGGYVMTNVSEPVRDKGLITSVFEPFDYAQFEREVWRYLPGSRRVRRAPTVGYDTPDGPGGLKTVDEVRGFNGAMDRFDWKLLGRKEYYIPYHAWKFDDPSLSYDQLLTKFHVNPDHMRWELHRVWVAEATLREGQRHLYGKRTIYVDEDTGLTVITENYDGRGELWKVVLTNTWYEYGSKAYVRGAEMYHDLRACAYLAERLVNDTAPFVYDVEPARGESYFQPANIRKLGRR